jgi:exonuclease III
MKSKRETYRIANWNLERPKAGTKKTKLAFEQIKKINADILVLTETSDGINLAPDYNAVKSISFEQNPTEQWITIWTKWRIKSRIETFDNKRTACAIIASPFGDLIVYGTIIPYHMAGVKGNRYAFSGYKVWELHTEDIIRQSEDWRRIKAKYGSTPFFVIGDFNQTRDGLPKGYGTINGRAVLTNQLKENGLRCVTETDFAKTEQLNLDKKKGKIRRNIDHICVSSNWLNSIQHYTIGAWDHFNEEGYYMSDHNGVYMDFDLK